jgi:hypothetical protein
MCAVQGAVLSTSDRGGIRIQYSKNPFGKKRDANGNWINTHDSPAAYAPYSPRCGTSLLTNHCRPLK